VAVLVAGITASSAWQTEIIRAMLPGDSQEIAGYTLVFEGVVPGQGPNYSYERGQFAVLRDGAQIAVMEPEKRQFFVQTMLTTEAAIRTTLMADLYVVLGDSGEDGSWAVRIYYNPLVPWIWGGCLMMVFGGLVSLTDRRLRLAIPSRRKTAAAVQPQAA
jgi:cytochrome c-type biogenesis protein CcmF